MLVGQRVFGLAMGYEDLNDHDELRYDPVMAILAGKLKAHRSDCAPLAGKSTLNRLELSRPEATRYHKISHDTAAIEKTFVDLFIEAHGKTAPRQISWIWTPPMIPYMATRKGGSSTAITTATATCRSTSSVVVTYWQPSCAAPTSMVRPARSRKSPGSLVRYARSGHAFASCCVLTAAFVVKT